MVLSLLGPCIECCIGIFYSIQHIIYFSKREIVKLLAIHASTDTRFNFLQKRGRSDDPQTKEHFNERDDRELGARRVRPL